MTDLDSYFGFLSAQAKNGALLLGHSEVTEWPSGVIPSLQRADVLVPTQNASHIKCPGCHDNCYVEPDVYMLADGSCHVQVLCRQQGCRVDIDAELLNQYEIIPEKLKELGYWIETDDGDSSGSQCLYSYEWLGDTWRLVFDGLETSISNRKGARLLATLLCNPFKDIYCLDLQAQESKDPILTTSEFEDVVADSEAINAYKDDLLEWKKELDDANTCNDFSRADAAQRQVDFITDHLLKLQGFNGRTRTFSTNAEKARKAVSKNILGIVNSEAFGRIPKAQQHFLNSIKYGKFICYSPEGDVYWNVKKNF